MCKALEFCETLTSGSVTLTCFLLLTIAGMDWVTRVQKFLLVILLFAQADMLIGESTCVALSLLIWNHLDRKCAGSAIRDLVCGEDP